MTRKKYKKLLRETFSDENANADIPPEKTYLKEDTPKSKEGLIELILKNVRMSREEAEELAKNIL